MGKTCSIVGASGYIGGEVARLVLGHPELELVQVTSESNVKKPFKSVHPNFRGRTDLLFSSLKDLETVEVLFLALPHGVAMEKIQELSKKAQVIVDLSEDFRLRSADLFSAWHDEPHRAPEWLSKFVYGLPELHREALKTANFIACPGCNPTAVILALAPLYRAGIVETDRTVVEAKISSSAAGNKPSLGSHHPERSGSVRSYQPTGHRHTGEMCQELGVDGVHFSATSIEMVRGILATAHVFLKENLEEKEIWKIYRDAYGKEPFIRIVKEASGVYRYPEPKIVMGTNFCDIGFERDPKSNRLVVMSAIDNLTRGSAGNAIQSLNIRFGWDETLGLEFIGLHPE